MPPRSTHDRPERGRGFAFAVAVVAALHVAKAFLFLAAGQAPLKWDSEEYWALARNLAGGRGFPEAHVHRPPGYPAFLAVHQALFGDGAQLAAVVTQLVAVVATALLTGLVAGRIARSRAAFLVAFALPLLWMELPYTALYLLSDTLLALLVAAFAAALTAWMLAPSAPKALLLGALLGVSMLVKPVMELAWIPVGVGMAWRLAQLGTPGTPLARALALHAGAFALALAATVGPWYLHNQRLHGEPFLTKFAGRTLWYSAFHPAAAGLEIPRTPEGRETGAAGRAKPFQAWSVFKGLVSGGRTPVESDDLMFRVALQAVRDEPGRFLSSVARRWVKFWTTETRHGYWKNNDLAAGDGARPAKGAFELRPVADLHEHTLDTWRIGGPVQLLAPLLAFLGLASAARRRELRPLALVLAALVLYLSLVVAATIVPMYRYRVPVDSLVVASAVAGAALLVRREG